VNVTTAAAASSVRLALYADVEDGQGGYPGALVAGSEVVVSSTVIGFVEGSIDVYLNPGLYWLVAASQGGTPALTCVTGMGTNVVGYQAAGTSAGRIAWVVDGVAGVFPATFDANANGQGGAPMVQFKVV